jgi:hypothetical protein
MVSSISRHDDEHHRAQRRHFHLAAAEIAAASCCPWASICASAGFLYHDPSVSGVVMTETDVERFRSEAQECRQLAERTINPVDKEAWLRLAEDWIKLAETAAEKRPLGKPERWPH